MPPPLASAIAITGDTPANVTPCRSGSRTPIFQNPTDLIYSVTKALFMGIAIVIVGCYYGYTAGGGPVRVGTATAKSMVLNIVLVHLVGMLGTQLFWGANPRAPIGG